MYRFRAVRSEPVVDDIGQKQPLTVRIDIDGRIRQLSPQSVRVVVGSGLCFVSLGAEEDNVVSHVDG